MGKTSLLQLVKEEIQSSGATVKQWALTGVTSIDVMMQRIRALGISDDEDDMKKVDNTWVLLDDAQNWYGERYWPFWQFLIKNLPSTSFGRCFIIVATTHDLSARGSPVHFANLSHFRKTQISGHEVDDLCAMHVGVGDELAWFLEVLKRLANLMRISITSALLCRGSSCLNSSAKTYRESSTRKRQCRHSGLRTLSRSLDDVLGYQKIFLKRDAAK